MAGLGAVALNDLATAPDSCTRGSIGFSGLIPIDPLDGLFVQLDAVKKKEKLILRKCRRTVTIADHEFMDTLRAERFRSIRGACTPRLSDSTP